MLPIFAYHMAFLKPVNKNCTNQLNNLHETQQVILKFECNIPLIYARICNKIMCFWYVISKECLNVKSAKVLSSVWTRVHNMKHNKNLIAGSWFMKKQNKNKKHLVSQADRFIS